MKRPNYKILIPSYNRADKQSTLQLLTPEFQRDDIILATQTENDFYAYSRYDKQATIIYKDGNCVGDNRNTLLEYCQRNGIKKALMLDDDIRALRILGGRSVKNKSSIRAIFDHCFQAAEKMNIPLWGAYITDNALSFKAVPSINELINGACMGFLDTSLRFNTEFRLKEDYELCLRLISNNRDILRFNHFAVQASFKAKGGCEADWARNSCKYGQLLTLMYPDLCKLHPNKIGEIKLIKR